jgi:hypothetical protein
MTPQQFLRQWLATAKPRFKESGRPLTADDLENWFGDPDQVPDPYLEEIQHVLDNGNFDIDPPLPPEIMAHKLSLWGGKPVPVSHPLVQNCSKYRDLWIESEYDPIPPEIWAPFLELVRSVVEPGSELWENLGDDEEHLEFMNRAPIEIEQIATIRIGDGGYLLGVFKDGRVALASMDGDLRIYNMEGQPDPGKYDEEEVLRVLARSPSRSEVTEPGELASIVGNRLADMIMPQDGNISLLDLPYET